MATAITRYRGEMLFETEVGGQQVASDVTPAMGGLGRAPTPPDLFVVSIGACIAAFVAHYCERHGIDTGGLAVETAFEKTEKPTMLTDFRVEVRLPNAELAEHAAAVERVAEHCIIHETLQHLKQLQIRVRDRTTSADA
jgi:putative redox protein